MGGKGLNTFDNKVFLTHHMPLVSFYTHWKHQNTIGFLIFPGMKREHWHVMGYYLNFDRF